MICPDFVCLRSRIPYMLSTMGYSLYDMSGSCRLEKQNSLYAQHHVVFTPWYMPGSCLFEKQNALYAQHHVVFTLRKVRFLSVSEAELPIFMLSTMWYSLHDMYGSWLLEKQNSLYAFHHVVFPLCYVQFLSVRETGHSVYAQHHVVLTLWYVPSCLLMKRTPNMLSTMWYSLYDMSGSCLLMNRTPYMLNIMWYSLYDMSASCLLKKQNFLYAQHHVVFTLWYVC